MNIVVADPKKGKSFTKKTEEPVFLNRKIGEEVELGSIGLSGFTGKLTGGSDNQGFPMKKSLQGSARKKLLMTKGIGITQHNRGEKRRKSVRGNTVSPETMQLNLVITKYGEADLSGFFSQPTENKGDSAESVKERMIKQSLENVGNVELAEEAKKIKGKVKR